MPGRQCSQLVVANPATNQIYVANFGTSDSPGNTVTVINGATDADHHRNRWHAAPNSSSSILCTNKIYVNNRRDSTVSVINGAHQHGDQDHQRLRLSDRLRRQSGDQQDLRGQQRQRHRQDRGHYRRQYRHLHCTPSPSDLVPVAVAVNPVTNKIYVINQCGTSNDCSSTAPSPSSTALPITPPASRSTGMPAWSWSIPLTNKIYVMNNCGNNSGSADCLANGTPTQSTVTVIDGATNDHATRQCRNGGGRAGRQPGHQRSLCCQRRRQHRHLHQRSHAGHHRRNRGNASRPTSKSIPTPTRFTSPTTAPTPSP